MSSVESKEIHNAVKLYHGCGIPEDKMTGDSLSAKRQLIADRSKVVVAVFATPDFASAGLFTVPKGTLYSAYSIGRNDDIISTGLISSTYNNFTEPLPGRVYEFKGKHLDKFIRTKDECYHEGDIPFNECIIHRDITLEKLMEAGVQIFRAKGSAQKMYDIDVFERNQGNVDTPEKRTQVMKKWLEHGHVEHMNLQYETAQIFDFNTGKMYENKAAMIAESNTGRNNTKLQEPAKSRKSQTFCELLASCLTGRGGR